MVDEDQGRPLAALRRRLDRRLLILTVLLVAGLIAVGLALAMDPGGMAGNLSAEAAGVLVGAGLIESLLLLDDRWRASKIERQRGSAVDFQLAETGRNSVLIHMRNTSRARISELLLKPALILGPPIPSEILWRIVDTEDFDIAGLSDWRQMEVDPGSLSILPGNALVVEVGFWLRHGEGAGGIAHDEIETTLVLQTHWLFGGDPTDYNTELKLTLPGELPVVLQGGDELDPVDD